MEFLKATLAYDEYSRELRAGKMTSFDELYVDFRLDKQSNYRRYQLTIHPKREVELKSMTLEFRLKFAPGSTVFCNGFQSWTESKEYDLDAKIPRLGFFGKRIMPYVGDYHIDLVDPDLLHSWTYGYVRTGPDLHLIGSLSEARCFSMIEYDPALSRVRLKLDCAGMKLKHSFPILDTFLGAGKEQAVFDSYFRMMELRAPRSTPLIGWTSWYHHYTNISEEIILNNVKALKRKRLKTDIIQIDDGYQKEVGDWLDIKAAFPNGMRSVAREIHKAGFKAGIWVAPFVCSGRSKLYRDHKDWLVKGKNGKPLSLGKIPLWGGSFYALDFYNKQVQDYLTQILLTLTQKWGYDFLKLDFLYAACVMPRPDKTRGQIMHDAMQFVYSLTKDTLLLGCGVPLGTVFGGVDFCRIGGDVHLKWENKAHRWMNLRERVSTLATLRSSIGRRQLNGRAFYNDPDVFILRKEKNKLNPEQQNTLLLINALLGDLLFTSDDAEQYEPEQISEYRQLYRWKKREVRNVKMLQSDIYQIDFDLGKHAYSAFCNLTAKLTTCRFGKAGVDLEAFESLVLQRKNGTT